MNVSEYVLSALSAEGIDHLFLMVGSLLDPLVSALEKSKIQGIVAAHEAGAIYMADGYAKISRKFGPVASIGGPGLLNMCSGIATAHLDKTPLFVITGEVATDMEGRGAFQDTSVNELNAPSILQSITSKRYSLTHKDSINPLVNSLLRHMLGHGTRGPVQLSIPVNIQKEIVSASYQPLPKSVYQPRFLDKEAAHRLWPLLRGEKKIAIVAGSGVLASEASGELQKTAEKFSIPVMTTLIAHSAFPQEHPLSMGVEGWYGSRHSMELLLKDKPDVLIVLGSRLHLLDSLCFTKDILPKEALVLVDICGSHTLGNYSPDLLIQGDVREFLRFLNQGLESAALEKSNALRKKWISQIQSSLPKYYDEESTHSSEEPIHPARVSIELRKALPDDAILFFGESSNCSIVEHYWRCKAPHQYFSTIKFMSPMGWSAAAAIGGKLAKPNATVVSLVGDGSMLMHGIEIQTAARYNIPVIFIVLNNGAHGNPQLPFLDGAHPFEFNFLKLPVHNWTQFAESMGVAGLLVKHPDELAGAFEKAVKMNKPVLIDIHTGVFKTPSYVFDHYAFGYPIPKGKI